MSADHDRRPRECVIGGTACPSIKLGAVELSRVLNKPVSYWRLYRALRKGHPEVDGVKVGYPKPYTPLPRLEVHGVGELLIRPHKESGLGVYRG